MVGDRREVEHLGPRARPDQDGAAATVPVQQHHVVGHVHRHPTQHLDALGDRPGRLEQVPENQGNRESGTAAALAGEGQGRDQAVVVHAVEQAPQAITGADHPTIDETA